MKLTPTLLWCALLPCVLSACRSQAASPPAQSDPAAAGGHRVPIHFTSQALAPDLQARLTQVLKTVAPGATVRRDGNQVFAEYHAHPAKLHPADMTGRRSMVAVTETVPTADGFVLTVSLAEGDSPSQTVLGMEQPTDFGSTYVDAYVLQPGILTAHLRLDRGKDTRPALSNRLKQEVQNWVRAKTHRANLQRPPG